jgi:hypothetical protein
MTLYSIKNTVLMKILAGLSVNALENYSVIVQRLQHKFT